MLRDVELQQARVIAEDGSEVPRGQIGRLAVRGPTGCRYLRGERQRDYVQDGWNVTGDTYVDTLRRAITQAALSNYMPDAIVINPAAWESIELTKGTDDHYVWANPAVAAGPQIWGVRVVPSNSIAAGTFLVGAFGMGAQIWDRMDASVQISFENDTNFVKNMATLLAEERLALTVYRPSAFISGSF